LWAAALHDNVGRFAADVTDTADNEPARCRSRAIVQSHFKSVKHGYKKSRKLRPRLFVAERLSQISPRQCQPGCHQVSGHNETTTVSGP